MKFHSAAAARACGCATHRLDAQLLASDFTFAPSGSGGNGGSSAPAAAPSALYPVPGFAESTARPSYAPNLVLEPFHMAIRLAFDLRAKRVRGTVTHSVRHNGPAAPSPATASLSRTLVLNAVSLDIAAVTSAGHAVSHTYDGKLLTATWETPFAPDEVRDLTVEYTAEDPIAGLYFCAPLPHEAAERVLHCATDHETERARYWLPCVDFPTVRTSLEFHLTHDAGLVAVANGAEVGVVENADGTKTTSYKLDHRCPSYLLCLAVGEFVTAEDETVDGMPIRYLATKNYTKEQLMLSFGKTPSMVRWLQKKVGHKFPWPKYYQIFTPFGGAMENISLVTYNDMFLIADEIRTREMGYFTDLVNLHEMAHTYFGDLLVVRHFEHAWLKESWATYMESCWLEDHKPKEEFEFDLFGNSEAYFEECNDYVRPIVCRTFNSSWNLFDRHLYPGGAMRIHMLRQILGDEAFWAGVRTYVSRFSGKIVETEDFKRCLEEASGLNLTRFFDQWLYSPGYPKLKATYKYHNDTGLAEVVLSQTQAPDDGSGVPAVFDITVEVDIVGEDGAVHSGAASFDSVIGLRTATVFIPIGKGAKKPLVVEIDPRNKVLHSLEFSPGEDVLGATAKRGRDIRSRIRSYRELIKDGSYTAMKKVKELLPEEPFFGVRNFVYSALSKSKSHASVSILASALHTERNTRALLRLLSNVSFRHPALRDGLLALSALPASETSYLARARVFEALGRQRHPDDVALLLARLADPTELGFQGSIRAGVLRGLGHTQSAAAHAALHAAVTSQPASSPLQPLRHALLPVAIGALAASASDGFCGAETGEEIRRGRKAAAEAIAEVTLRAGQAGCDQTLLGSALRALTRLEASELHGEAAAAVKAYAAEQDLPEYRSKLKALSGAGGSGGGGDAAKLAKLVEAMEEKIKKLEGVVEEMEKKSAVREAAEEAAKEAAEKAEKAKDATAAPAGDKKDAAEAPAA